MQLTFRTSIKINYRKSCPPHDLVSKGQIEVGKDADLCFLNNQLDITDVILNGEIGMKDQVIIKKVDTKMKTKYSY